MKEYEVYSSLKVPKNSKIIVRLDGRSFHKLADDLDLVKPYDGNFYRVSLHLMTPVYPFDQTVDATPGRDGDTSQLALY